MSLEEQASSKGNACLERVEPSPLEGFSNSCQDFIYSWSIFSAVEKTLYSPGDHSSPVIHTSVSHTALTCATPRISLFFPGRDHSSPLQKGFEDAKTKPISKGLRHYFVERY